MINKEEFSDLYSPTKIDEIVNQNADIYYYKDVYRMIKHSKNLPLTSNDFLPTIMEYNNFLMPPYDKQNLKTNNEQFSMSCFDTKEHLECFIESVTSIRENFYTNNWYIMKGHVNKHKGFADKARENGPKVGHINYYLYDPIRKNPIEDFEMIEEEDKK